jgi:hypothetical protein
MQNESEVIALVLPDAEPGKSGRVSRSAHMLVRNAAGNISLESVDMDSPLGQYAMTTGCFRRGKTIFDPVSRQILGYEMEMIGTPLGAMNM